MSYDEPKGRVTIRDKGEYLTLESREQVGWRLATRGDDFVRINVLVALEYRPMTVNKHDVMTVEDA